MADYLYGGADEAYQDPAQAGPLSCISAATYIYICILYIYINPGILQPAQVMPYWSRGEVGVVRQPLEDQTRSQAFIFMRQCFKIGVGRIFGGVLEGALCCHSECSGEDQLGGASSSVHQSGYLSAVWGFIN